MILGTNRIEIETWQGADTAQPIWKNAGSTLISANSLDGIFHIVERRPNAVKLPTIGYIAKSKMLLTTCDPNASDDDRWISRGLEYYY